jgi:hypothetical protein
VWDRARVVGGGLLAAVLVTAALVLTTGVPCCSHCDLLWGWLPICSWEMVAR